ncbi:hypothetical protein FGG08_002440 [Glutinoglossum americanum]|uniref:Elongation of fatty acids protein n=1 Tax=Glutinoglossum americanum TaxID=1670608 RepID=A0A9P8L4I3_9PEZI|nr:hypothetical protein FGG08_002440 [Glutinoglossum americanum]
MAVTPSILFSPSSSSLPRIPPNSLPYTLPPPPPTSPFAIPESLYRRLLSANYPITIALVYATTVTILNRVNASRGNKPWPFWWTFVGMVKAVHRSVGPSLRGQGGVAGVWDAVCKIHGPSGLGNAVSYNETLETWVVFSPTTAPGAPGTPLSTDTGRLWNEGLAFYGWIFYLSKFYEVVDTAIILAKGKRSSTLQVYHHAGAMLCMWAGIRYMAPPIFMFCLFNSCIHTMMIIQFIVGSLFASSNLFISYSIPIEVPYVVLKDNISTTVSSATSVAASIAMAATPVRIGSLLKRLALRAAGEPGLAENIATTVTQQGQKLVGSVGPSAHKVYETHFHTEYRTVPCLYTSGEAFAIWLNVIYLAPLTWLFVRFFIRSYLRRTSPTTKQASAHIIEKAAGDAAHGIGAPTYANGNAKTNGHAQTNGHAETNGHANGTADKE